MTDPSLGFDGVRNDDPSVRGEPAAPMTKKKKRETRVEKKNKEK